MKTYFALFLSLVITISGFAADASGSITLLFSNYRNYNVLIDGQRIYQENSRVRLNNIHTGRHSIEVYSMNRNWKNNTRPVYASSFVVKPHYDVFIQLDGNGYVQISERRNLDNKSAMPYGKQHHKNGKGNHHVYRSNDYGGNHYDDKSYDEYYNYKGEDNRNREVSEYEFNNILDNINRQSYNKQNVALDAVMRNYFTTRQIRTILYQFGPDEDKLQIAKMAYRNTIDRQNYYQLYDVFTYENSRDALDRFIRSYR